MKSAPTPNSSPRRRGEKNQSVKLGISPLRVINARIWLGGYAEPGELYAAGRIEAAPRKGAVTIDLSGYTLYPGLVNAHDHLEFNHYPRTKFRDIYGNAHEWGEDVNARLDLSPLRELRALPLDDRLLIGGLKNLLSGATTVAHHNPPHRALWRDFPVRVVRRCGWAHSLHFASEAEVVASYRRTSKDTPWVIHLAEGTDAVATAELDRLAALGCAGENTVAVHAVALTAERLQNSKLRGLVWCPTSNRYLLGAAADARGWLDAGLTVALGSDSRLTADGDLLDELRATYATGQITADEAVTLVTTHGAALFGLPRAGHLNPGADADFIAVPNGLPLHEARRADLGLVVLGGVPQVGEPALMAQFPGVPTVAATVDGRVKAIRKSLVVRLTRCRLHEPGLTFDALPAAPRRRWLFPRGS